MPMPAILANLKDLKGGRSYENKRGKEKTIAPTAHKTAHYTTPNYAF